jgi:hypothetical protein
MSIVETEIKRMNMKYPRTPHLPWSPGVSNDDRIIDSLDSLLNRPVVILEKLDGSNVCLESDSVFARSHSGPPTHPSFDRLKALHAANRWQIPPDYQVFGEWVYAVHSIKYDHLPGYLMLFGARDLEVPVWEPWAFVQSWAQCLEVHAAPVLAEGTYTTEAELKAITEKLANQPSLYGATREGVVVRAAGAFKDEDFGKCVAKWVRPGHVDPAADHWAHQTIVKNGLGDSNGQAQGTAIEPEGPRE